MPKLPTDPSPLWLQNAAAQRYLRPVLERNLAQKMVILGGPRQVGKTSVGRSLIPNPQAEMNYDVVAQRQAILRHELPDRKSVV